MKKIILTLLAAITLTACSPGLSIIYGDNYDVKNDVTVITFLPLGGVKVPGKWTKNHENEISHQYFFDGPDSTTFAVALNPWKRYEFYNDQVTPENFVRKFYEWDANYLKEQIKGEIRIVKEDKEKNFIIWNLWNSERSEYFLFGLKGEVAYNLYFGSDAWDEPKQVELLEKIYTQ